MTAGLTRTDQRPENGLLEKGEPKRFLTPFCVHPTCTRRVLLHAACADSFSARCRRQPLEFQRLDAKPCQASFSRAKDAHWREDSSHETCPLYSHIIFIPTTAPTAQKRVVLLRIPRTWVVLGIALALNKDRATVRRRK
jgi:hypothetical protein